MVWFLVTIIFVFVLTPTILVWTGRLETGFSGKTLWDWLEVVGIPVTVVIIAGAFGIVVQRAGRRAEEQRERDIDLAREATLHAYLDDMTKLMLADKLQEAKEGSAGRVVAQARTCMALRTLDGPRKGLLLQFLKDSQLINRGKPILRLDLADLTSANLSSADLSGIDLHAVSLRDADLGNSKLRDSDLSNSVLVNADLHSSDLTNAILTKANLHNADLRRASVTKEQLDSASDLSDALLP